MNSRRSWYAIDYEYGITRVAALAGPRWSPLKHNALTFQRRR